MTFHSDFWVLAGTAAPVIALAAVVAVSDGLAGRLESSTNKRMKLNGEMSYLPLIQWPYWISSLNFLVQTLVLPAALFSLNMGENILPPSVVAVFEGLAVTGLLIVGLIVATQRHIQHRRAREAWAATAWASLEGKAPPDRWPD